MDLRLTCKGEVMKAMRKVILSLFLAAGGGTLTEAALAEPVIDYVPVSARLDHELADDVSGARHWVVTIGLKNQGNVQGQPRTMKITVGGYQFTASVYGGAASGHVLYGTIKPGETGTARIA